MLATIDGLPLTQLEPRRKDVLAAAKIKAHYPVSYADAFAIAAARELGCPLMTGDPEFKKVAHLVEIVWLQ
ncbi:MAG: type II toxin-antitoxin system VapC family toxin [Chloroflexi bacterium]|nr:type II toxin-antitoxin system VapC family toxin [Chloroflexota bacterium]